MGPPKVVDRYEMRQTIGTGAMGTVHLAWDPKLHREVAIKILRSEVSKDKKVRTRFGREARAVAALRHPNIVEIYDYSGEESEHLYIVMEKLEGDDLFNIIADHGAMPEPAAAAVGHELCLALNVAHEANVIHRDMKPENVFISPQGRVVLTDFGIVKAIDESAAIDGGGKATDIIGTPGFMPPELMMNKGLGPFTDVFALGALLYNIATGQLPFDGPGPVEIFRKMMAGEFEDPRLHNSFLSEEFCLILAGTLEPKPRKRTQTVAEVRESLKVVLANAGVTDLRDDMREYMTGPKDYWEAARKRCADALLRRIKIATKDKSFQLAEDLRLRLSILDPDNTEVHAVSGLMQLPKTATARSTGKSGNFADATTDVDLGEADFEPEDYDDVDDDDGSSTGSIGGNKLIFAGGALAILAVVAAIAFIVMPNDLPDEPEPPIDGVTASAGTDANGVAVGGSAGAAGDPTAGTDPAGVEPTAVVENGSVEIVFKGIAGVLWVDGEKVGRVKKKKVLKLTVGEHLFEAKTAGLKAKKRLAVSGGNTTKIIVELRKQRITARGK